MALLSWILLGLLSGSIASAITGKLSGAGCVINILVGMVGSLIGGVIVTFLTYGELRFTAFTNFNLISLLVSTLGAVIFLAIVGSARKK